MDYVFEKYEPWWDLELLKSCYDAGGEVDAPDCSVVVSTGGSHDDPTPGVLWGYDL